MSVKPVDALAVPPRTKPSNYPPVFAARMTGREKRALGEAFGLANFGVNLVRLAPGARSALHHRHARQDEFVYVLEGTATIVVDDAEHAAGPGTCIGFRAGGAAHHVENRSATEVVYLEVGDRLPGDAAEYPHDDLAAVQDADGRWRFVHRDGTPW
jgi:uncharacterized cupin superfamily protein